MLWGVRRVSCPLLGFSFVARNLPVLLRRWVADRGTFFGQNPLFGIKLKADSNRESYMILKMRREEILFTYGTEGRKKTLNLTDIKRPFGQRDAFWAAARWLYNERLESGIFGNLWRGHDIWWTPCISLNKANMIQGRTQDLLGFAGKTLVLWER